MRLVCLGTNGLHPNEDGRTACYMIPELGIVLDAGSGLYRISKYMQTSELVIYLTHSHTDHFIGLPDCLNGAIRKKIFIESELRICDENMRIIFDLVKEFLNRVRVCAPEITLGEVLKYPELPDVNWCTMEVKDLLPGDGVITYFPLEHTIKCFGFRLDWPGHSLAYVTDTIARPESPYIEKIKGVNVLLHECYMPDSLSNVSEQLGHSHTSAVAQVAAEAQVKRLVLIHHNTLGLKIGLASACEIFPETEIGFDGMEIEF